MTNLFSRRLAMAATVVAAGLATGMPAQESVAASKNRAKSNETTAKPLQLEVLPVQGRVHVIAGAGANVGVQVGEDGIFVVDAGNEASSAALLREIERLGKSVQTFGRTGVPIRYIVDTHLDPEHMGGNKTLREAGETISGGNEAVDNPRGSEKGAVVMAHEAVLTRMAGGEALTPGGPEAPESAWPTETFSNQRYDFTFNDEVIEILHFPDAHSDGDVIVHFRGSDVIFAGDLFITTSYPEIDLERGGSIAGLLDALNTILEITVPHDKQEGGTMVVTGHGRICDEADVVEYRDMLTILKDRIEYLVSQGMSLQQIQAAKPTSDYDGRYSAASGPGEASRFIEAVYKSLAQRSSQSGGRTE
jgi:glyoxylase-like metal-dependent hydrolase (beta-lactamase superfamily II)